jgi:hypothetical protein
VSSPNPSTSDQLVWRDAPPLAGVDPLAMQQLWVAIQRRPWRSLAVVSGSEGISTIEVATVLSRIAWYYRGQPSCVVDLRDVSLRLLDYHLQEIAAQMNGGEQSTIISLRSIYENPTVASVVNVADAAVICVRLGVSKIASARRTVDEIGRDKFIGTIVLRNPEGNTSGR